MAVPQTIKFRVVQALVPGANVIAHNLALTSTVAQVDVRDNTSGAIITAAVTAETANTITLNVGAAVVAARITVFA